jgi:hypothetical protein
MDQPSPVSRLKIARTLEELQRIKLDREAPDHAKFLKMDSSQEVELQKLARAKPMMESVQPFELISEPLSLELPSPSKHHKKGN